MADLTEFTGYKLGKKKRGPSLTERALDALGLQRKPRSPEWRSRDYFETAGLRNIVGVPADRCFVLQNAVRALKDVPGDVAECGLRFGKSTHYVDVDLYQPRIGSLEFFWPRMVPGGIVVCDDYGSRKCPGAKRAFDEFFADGRGLPMELPTSQALVFKPA